MEPDIEVRVRMANINSEKKTVMMEFCRPLAEYAWLVEEIHKNGKEMGNEEAVDKAIDDMPGDYVIRSFLIGNKAQVKNMCITEYNEAKTIKMIPEEGQEEREDKLGRLVTKLISLGRNGDVQRAAADKEVRTMLYKELNIV